MKLVFVFCMFGFFCSQFKFLSTGRAEFSHFFLDFCCEALSSRWLCLLFYLLCIMLLGTLLLLSFGA